MDPRLRDPASLSMLYKGPTYVGWIWDSQIILGGRCFFLSFSVFFDLDFIFSILRLVLGHENHNFYQPQYLLYNTWYLDRVEA